MNHPSEVKAARSKLEAFLAEHAELLMSTDAAAYINDALGELEAHEAAARAHLTDQLLFDGTIKGRDEYRPLPQEAFI